MKRLFIAINLPDEIKQKIKGIVREIQTGGEIRFLKPETWHITITFLGYQPDDAIPAVIESMKGATPILSRVIASEQRLKIEFDKVIFGPPGKRPRMIWLVAANETSKNLALLKNKLEDELVKNNVQFQREKRGLGAAHVTLARFQATRINADIKRINADIISVNQRINASTELSRMSRRQSAFAFQAKSLDLMESHLKRTGVEYEALSGVDFKK